MKFIYVRADGEIKETFEADDLKHQGSCVALLLKPVFVGGSYTGIGNTVTYATPRDGCTLGVINLAPGERIIACYAQVVRDV